MTMLGLSLYTAARPTDYVVKYVNGQKRKEGQGKVFLVGPRTTVACVSTADLPISFAFTELSSDGQEVLAEGELHVQLVPEAVLSRRDFTVDPKTNKYLTDDYQKVQDEVRHTLQTFIRVPIQQKSLKDNLVAVAVLQNSVLKAIGEHSEPFTALGVKVLNLFVLRVKPRNVDLTKALEAEAREKMLSAADKAIAERRMSAAESDRKLKAYEAETALGMEKERAQLIEVRNANSIAEATADAEATQKRMAPIKDMDPKTLVALAIQKFAETGNVGQLNITSELLAALGRASGNGDHR